MDMSRPTPETDAFILSQDYSPTGHQWRNFTRQLERERDEVKEKLADWENSAAHVEDDYPDEKHCACVPVLRKLLADARRERDEAREQLRKASVEANTLATSIQKAEYSDAKEFELLGSVAGVISQIDNMYAGVRQQRDEAREEIKELIYIAERAIALAEIDFENDKFGVVSELRYELKQIMQEGAK